MKDIAPHVIARPTPSTEQQRLVNALGDFLSEFHWQWFVTATFKYQVSEEFAKRVMKEWLTQVSPNAYAWIAPEQGALGGSIHCHALAGGIVNGSRDGFGLRLRALAIKNAKRQWQRGDIQIETYDRRRGAAWYVSKWPDAGEPFGNLQRHRRRA